MTSDGSEGNFSGGKESVMRSVLVSVVLLAAAIVTAAAGYRRAVRTIPPEKQWRGTARLLYLGYAVAMLWRKLLAAMRMDLDEDRFFREMYINEGPEDRRLTADCCLGLGLLGITVGLAVTVLCVAHAGGFSATPLRRIGRPESGTGIARISAEYHGRKYNLSLPVTERQLTTEELLQNAAEAEEKMLSWVLGRNKSADYVTQPLVFPDRVPGTPIAISWSTSDYRIVDYSGAVHTESCEPGGQPVTLTAQLTYGDWEETMQIPIRVVHVNEATDDGLEKLAELLRKSADEQAYEDEIVLPERMEGEGVAFYEERRYSPWMFGLYAVLLVVTGIVVIVGRRRKQRTERQRQLLRDYPDLVSKFTLLMEAGSTIRMAWERIADDYARRREGAQGRRYVYEEMLHARNRMSLGIPEEVAYEEFGKRCANIRYLRFSSVLVQNLKKGSASVLPLLHKESREAFCDRAEQAKQKGEEAGTRLLLPMAGILVVILAMVLIPAFMSF